ncbi:hypothetical protein HBF26_06570 [Luteibacter jiangsuensis]|uniref:Uncharacterized protein n=1 Tax=Luteibacter jiangsuensis TaxID=637577 RepID=A0ABX0Q1Z0_9GAMM|nr:hypothetical protein [Luteibacter jiangsuensis]NID04541.1 hypothetical protein [Luteibacter jiangsuensis]
MAQNVWVAAVFVACLAPSLCTNAMDAADGVDVAKMLLTARTETSAGTMVHGSLAAWREQLSPRANEPYGPPVDRPAFVNEVYWRKMLASLPALKEHGDTERQAMRALQWDLGTTKARPGQEIPHEAMSKVDLSRLYPQHRDPLVVAGIAKAGVDADIFSAALAVTTDAHSTVAANYAVAAQIIRDRARAYPPEAWPRMGIRAGIVDRLVASVIPEDFADPDRRYLSLLVEQEARTRRVGLRNQYGLRGLSTPYRVARLAAAYRDGQGYALASTFPCGPDGSHQPGAGTQAPGDHRPLCFVDASDNAVYRWYADEMWNQAHPAWKASGEQTWIALMFFALSEVLFGVDIVPSPYFVESEIAADLVDEEIVAEVKGEASAESESLLTCRIP